MSGTVDINDTYVRIIGITFFGIVIPNATGLIEDHRAPWLTLAASYAYFIFIAFSIWQGNRFLLFKLQERYNWLSAPSQKALFLIASNIAYTAPLTVILLLGWFSATGRAADWHSIQLTTIVCVVCVIFVTHVYETVFLIKERESDIRKGEQLQRAKAQAELEALKNQIDPHFMFNSLNSISYLIDRDPVKARLFVESLAEVYRYILSNKDHKLVLLGDELAFLEKYVALLRLRFEKALEIHFEIGHENRDAFLIPPISIFVAVENAVKHNELSKRQPLKVDIRVRDNVLFVTNPILFKKQKPASSQIGLTNLDERFRIITGSGIHAAKDNGVFELRLPMLRLAG